MQNGDKRLWTLLCLLLLAGVLILLSSIARSEDIFNPQDERCVVVAYARSGQNELMVVFFDPRSDLPRQPFASKAECAAFGQSELQTRIDINDPGYMVAGWNCVPVRVFDNAITEY